jgi:hypothetical protein
MTCTGVSDVQGSLVHSENESTGGLQQQRLERFYLEKRGEKLHEGGKKGDPETSSPMETGFLQLFCFALGQRCLSGANRSFLGRRGASLTTYHFWDLLQSILQFPLLNDCPNCC